MTWCATLADVRAALETTTDADDAQLGRLIDAASDHAEAVCRRLLRPEHATRYYPWPATPPRGRSWSLPLDTNGLISVTAVVTGGVDVVADALLEPQQYGPPYDRLELDRSTSSAFTSGDTPQRSVAVTGLWGYRDDQAPAGALAEALDSSETAVDVTAAGALALQVGALAKVDSERLFVTGRTYVDSTVNLAGALGDEPSDVAVSVGSGAAFVAGETVQVDSERMLVRAISSNTLTVQRAVDGTVLASHLNGADVYAVRTLTVERGHAGSTAAAHSDAATITVWEPPPLVRTAVVRQVVTDWTGESAGGADPQTSAGAGQTGDPSAAWERARRAYGRSLRHRSV